MKKNRAGRNTRRPVPPGERGRIEATLFRETPTLGVRRWLAGRRVLPRQASEVETPWGPVP